MKKIIAIVLLLALVACSLVACKKTDETPATPDNTPVAKDYKLAVVVDEGLATVSKGGATVIALALVWDAEGKIVAARFDSVQPKFALNADKTDIVAVDRVTTKVELGEDYGMVNKGHSIAEWDVEAAAFEQFLLGKTAADVAAFDVTQENVQSGNLVAGCTMYQSVPVFQALVAKAFAYERAVSFSTAETVTLGLAIDCAVSGSVANGGKITADVAGVAVAGGKVVASMIDSMEGKYTLAIGEDQKLTVTLKEYKGTKNEQGDAYGMVAYSDPQAIAEWYVQAQAFADATVGKTAADVAALDTSAESVKGETPLVAGCTMTSSTPVFQTLVAKAFAYERKVTFTTSETVTAGLAIDAKLTGGVEDGAKVSADYAAVAIAGGKVVASMIDSCEATYAFAYNEETEKYDVTASYKGTKNEQGDAYDSFSPMPSGRWYAQAQAYANTAVGKTVAELNDLSTEKIEGSCSIYTGGYKAVIVRAAGYAR